MMLSMLVGAVSCRLGVVLLRAGFSSAVFYLCLFFRFVFYSVKLAALHSYPTLRRAVVEIFYRSRGRCFGFFRQCAVSVRVQIGSRFSRGLSTLPDRLVDWLGMRTIAVSLHI